MTTANPFDYLQQQAQQLGVQAVQGAQSSLPGLVQAASQAVQQEIPVLAQAATKAVAPAAHDIGVQAGAGAREGATGGLDTTEWVLFGIGGAAVLGLFGLAAYTAAKPSHGALNSHKGALAEARDSLRRALDWANEKSAELAAAEAEVARRSQEWKTALYDPKLDLGSKKAADLEAELLPRVRAAQARAKAAEAEYKKAVKLAGDWSTYVSMQLPKATQPIAKQAEALSDELRNLWGDPKGMNALTTVYAGRRAALAPEGETERAKALLRAADDLGLVSKPKLERIFPHDARVTRAVPLRTALSWVNAHITAS